MEIEHIAAIIIFILAASMALSTMGHGGDESQ